MSDFLALDWEHRQVCGLDAEVSKAGVRVRQAFTLTWPEGKSPDVDAPAAGGWLNEQFQTLGLIAKRVLVTVPREDVVVRVLEVPNVPDAELPEVVKFQAAAVRCMAAQQASIASVKRLNALATGRGVGSAAAIVAA